MSSFKIVKGVSHTDHLSDDLLVLVAKKFSGRSGFFIESFDVPGDIAQSNNLTNALYGPISGDEPVGDGEVRYAPRPGREWDSRLIDKPARPTTTLTVIAGPSAPGESDCVMYTAFGGPASPREVGDPAANIPESIEFWTRHALAAV